MKRGDGFAAEAARAGVRRAGFEDVPAVLRLIEAAVEHGCRGHYSAAQRRAVFLTYAESLFVDVLQPFETIVVERLGRGQILGMAQLDPDEGRLRALFVAPDLQGSGLGRVLLATIERVARAHGLRAIQGAMSLNAVEFYGRAGFRRCSGPEHLVRAGIVVPIVPMDKALDSA